MPKRNLILTIVLTLALSALGVALFLVRGLGVAKTVQTVRIRYDTYITLSEGWETEVASYAEDALGGSSRIAVASDGGEVIVTVKDAVSEETLAALQSHYDETYPDAEFFVTSHAEIPSSATGYLTRCAIAAAILCVGCFVYTAIRYRVSHAIIQLCGGCIAALLALALPVVLFLPVGEFLSVSALAALAVGEALCFPWSYELRAKDLKELAPAERVAAVSRRTRSFAVWTFALAGIALAVVSALSFTGMWSSFLCALLALVGCAGTGFLFLPAAFALCETRAK